MNSKHQLTAEGLKKSKEELDFLKNVERPKVIESLQEARAQGDLSENAEYDTAKNKLDETDRRIKELEDIIKNSDVILGKTVIIEYADGTEKELTIVGSLEADPINNKISNESPVGYAIMSKKIGEKALVRTPNGKEFEIIVKKIVY